MSGDMRQAAAITHSFSLAYIDAEMQFDGFMGEERKVSFQELAQDPRGDCDDFVMFNTGLLLAAGVNPRDLMAVVGAVDLQIGGMPMPPGHTFLVPRNGDSYIALDNNFEDAHDFDPFSPTITGNLYLPDVLRGKVDPLVSSTLAYATSVFDARGRAYRSVEAWRTLAPDMSESLNDMMERFREVLVPECIRDP